MVPTSKSIPLLTFQKFGLAMSPVASTSAELSTHAIFDDEAYEQLTPMLAGDAGIYTRCYEQLPAMESHSRASP